ncbi:MAG: RsmB/NOP family class I SAM-dependent RNA methyltransferase [Alphaproteobacteria bacterium]
MTPAAHIAETIKLLKIIQKQKNKPASQILARHFREARYVGAKDRRLIADFTFDILRHIQKLTWWAEEIGVVSERQITLLGMVFLRNYSMAAIQNMFSGATHHPDLLLPEEKTMLQGVLGKELINPAMPENIQAECPIIFAPSLQKKFGDEFVAVMSAMTESAPMDCRIHPLRTQRDKMLQLLKHEKVKATATPISPLNIRVTDPINLRSLPFYKNGHIEIQDEGSTLVALLTEAKADEKVVDFCAGAGGKTLVLSSMMENKGTIVATDVIAGKLKELGRRADRAQTRNITEKLLRDERDSWVSDNREQFDLVLVDAPCSGTGTWRRQPDMRFVWDAENLADIRTLQSSILYSASQLVKPGGRLVYATCSLMPEENEAQVDSFLQNASDFKVVPVQPIWERAIGDDYPFGESPYLELSPYHSKTDGFFAAFFVKE